MKMLKPQFVFIFFLSMISNSVRSQTNDECRYLMVLNYLQSSMVVKQKADLYFREIVDKKDKYIELNLSDRIDFLGISLFREQLKIKNYGIETELNNDSLYYVRYSFKSFRSEFLRKIRAPNNSKLFLTFSKPVDDYLVVELRNYDPEMDGNRKFGKALQLFFKFDSAGIIADVLFAGAAYN